MCILILCLLPELGNQNPKSELLIVFTSQNKVGNRNQNCGAHHNLGMRNERRIPKTVVMSLLFPGLTILPPYCPHL